MRKMLYENEIETDTETEIDKENQLGVQDLNAEAVHFLRMYPIYLSLSRTVLGRVSWQFFLFRRVEWMLMVFHNITDL